MRRLMLSLAAATGTLLGACPALAQAPSPISSQLHSFPGSVLGTTTATSSGMALADRWLGDEPFLNPAMAPAHGLGASLLLQRVSRQDLRAANRQLDDTPFFDVSGDWLAFTAGRMSLFAYGWQPVLRREDIAFIRGEEGGPSAVVTATSTQREMRGGVGASFGAGAWRLGVAGEWNRRDDDYQYTEVSGDPGQGTREVKLSGTGYGVAAGGRAEFVVLGGRALTLGAALHTVPALTLTGEQTLRLFSGDSDTPLSVRRGSALEAGVSARLAISAAVRLLAQAGGRSEQTFEDAPGVRPAVVPPPASLWGPGLRAGPATQWSLGFEYTEPEQPLTLRLGGGQETQTDVPEPRAGVYTLGAGWRFDEKFRLDLAVVRRAFARAGKATSYDDRVVATIGVGF